MRGTMRQRAGAWMGGMLLLVAGTAAPVWGQQSIVPPPPVLITSPVVTVNNSAGQQTDPHVSKDLVSYTDDGPIATIRYYRFSTGFHSVIPLALGAFDTLSDVNGDLISFSRQSADRRALMVFNTATSALMEIDPQVGTSRFHTALGGNTLAFLDCGPPGICSNGDIMAYDLAANTLTNVSASPFFDGNPNVAPDGNTIVCENCPTLINCDIAKAVRSGGAWTVSSIATTLANEGNPDTDGTWIAYDSERASPTGMDLYFQPVAGGTETQLALAGVQRNPSLSQGVIAFESLTGFNPADLFVYVIATNTLYQVTATATFNESLNDVSVLDNGDIRVVWAANDGFGGDQNIYATTFTPTLSITDILSFFDASVASGSLVGAGPGGSANGRLGALRNMIRAAGQSLSQGDIGQACQQLKNALDRTDGNVPPPDFVSGAAAAQLATMLRTLRTSLGCG